MIQLGPADYIEQPWKNGKGITVQMWQLVRDGRQLVRISRAVVTEDGPFSIFPGIERNLTVLSGPGFRLTGKDLDLRCDPLVPVAFPGDLHVAASETGNRPSEDFNLMTDRNLPQPEVSTACEATLPQGGLLALYAMAPANVNGRSLSGGDMLLTETAAAFRSAQPMIIARILGV